MTLAERIEALTDEECLSLTGPWKIKVIQTYERPLWLLHNNDLMAIGAIPDGCARTFDNSIEAHEEKLRRNAAHVRERLLGLMA